MQWDAFLECVFGGGRIAILMADGTGFRKGLVMGVIFAVNDTAWKAGWRDLKGIREMGCGGVTVCTFPSEMVSAAATQAMHDRMVQAGNAGLTVTAHPCIYALGRVNPGGIPMTGQEEFDHLRYFTDAFGGQYTYVDWVNEPFPPTKPENTLSMLLHRARVMGIGMEQVRMNFTPDAITNLTVAQDVGALCAREGVRVIGLQAHVGEGVTPGVVDFLLPQIRRCIQEIRGVCPDAEVHVSELSIPSGRDGWTESLQALWLDRLVRLFVAEGVTQITYWDTHDTPDMWNATTGLFKKRWWWWREKPAAKVWRELAGALG